MLDNSAGQEKAQTAFNDAKAKCDSLSGDANTTCMTDANTARTDAIALAKTESEGKGEASDGAATTQDGMKNPSTQPKYRQ
jgi:hypothetical protein